MSQPVQETITKAQAHTTRPSGDLVERAARFTRSLPVMHRFTWLTRVLLVMGFMPTGLVKLLNHRFTSISIENPMGLFFEGLYQATGLWMFIGLMQIVASSCLLIPGCQTLGALMFFPIILSIVLITWSIPFGLTAIITSLMLLAVVYLLVWDYARIKRAFCVVCGHSQMPIPAERPPMVGKIERVGWVGVTVTGVLAFAATRGFVPMRIAGPLIIIGFLSGLTVLASFAMASLGARRQRRLGVPASSR